MDWYYSKNDVQMGPVSLAELQEKLARGYVSPSDMAWHEGMADWKPCAEIAELNGRVGTAGSSDTVEPVAVSSVEPASNQSPNQTPTPPVVSQGQAPLPTGIPVVKTSSLAIVSLICGAAGCFGLFICCFPGLIGIGGIICGHLALSEIKKSNGQVEGRGLAIAGLVCGYLSVALVVIYMLFAVVMGVFNSKPSTLTPTPFEIRQSI